MTGVNAEPLDEDMPYKELVALRNQIREWADNENEPIEVLTYKRSFSGIEALAVFTLHGGGTIELAMYQHRPDLGEEPEVNSVFIGGEVWHAMIGHYLQKHR